MAKESTIGKDVHTLVHDLRGSIAAANGFVQALREDYSDRLEAEGRQYLERIERNLRNMQSRLDEWEAAR